MCNPDFIYDTMYRTDAGALPTSLVQRVRSKLLRRGFVLLPSDTCYSLGALALDEGTRKNVNTILSRQDDPISVAFSSYLQVERMVEVSNSTALLFERFTPGPITIVTKANQSVSEEFTAKALGSHDRTIGVRLPDSFIEREIAGSTQFPLMSVAIRDSVTGEPIQDFQKAIQKVKHGIEKLGGAGWLAIEGEHFYALHSTIIRSSELNRVELLREGDIMFDEITSVMGGISGSAMEDWG